MAQQLVTTEYQTDSGLVVLEAKPIRAKNLSLNLSKTVIRPVETSDEEWDNPTPPKAIFTPANPKGENVGPSTVTSKERSFKISNSPKLVPLNPAFQHGTRSRFHPSERSSNSLLQAFGKNPHNDVSGTSESPKHGAIDAESRQMTASEKGSSVVGVKPSISVTNQLRPPHRDQQQNTQPSARTQADSKTSSEHKIAFVRQRKVDPKQALTSAAKQKQNLNFTAGSLRAVAAATTTSHPGKAANLVDGTSDKIARRHTTGITEPTDASPYGIDITMSHQPSAAVASNKMKGVAAKTLATTEQAGAGKVGASSSIRIGAARKVAATLNNSHVAIDAVPSTKIVPRPARHTSVGPLKPSQNGNAIHKKASFVQGTQKEADEEAQLKKIMTTIRAQQLDQTFQTVMNKYLQVQSGPDGVARNGVLIFVSGDGHISRFMTAQNWLVTYRPMVIGFELFHLKWVVQDKASDYESILPDQYINHFQNNKELTSKSFLKKNLEMFVDAEIPHDEYFPKSYDLSSPEEAKALAKDYLLNCLFVVLKKQIVYFCRRFGGLAGLRTHLAAETARIAELLQRDRESKERIYFSRLKPSFNVFFVDSTINLEFKLCRCRSDSRIPNKLHSPR